MNHLNLGLRSSVSSILQIETGDKKMVSPSPLVFETLLVLSIIIYLTVIGLYILRRNTFPIAQRKPELCLAELVVELALSVCAGAMGMEDRSQSSSFQSCLAFSVLFSLRTNATALLTAVRMIYVVGKDFTTKLLLLESGQLGLTQGSKMEQQKTLFETYSTNNPFFKLFYKLASFVLKRTSFEVDVALLSLPAIILGAIDVVLVSIEASRAVDLTR
jgi:hypothetical protein